MDTAERVFVRPGEEQKVRVSRRQDGFWTLSEETRFWEDPHPAIGDGYFYWAPTEGGISLFDTVEAALLEAAARYPWVKEQLGRE